MTCAKHPCALMIAAALTLAGCMKPNPLAELVVVSAAEDSGDEDEDDEDDGDAPGEGEGGEDQGDPLPDLAGGNAGEPDPSCAPLEPLDSACTACLGGSCCESAALCAGASPCACLVACDLAGGNPGSCKNQCGAKPEDHPEVALLLACAHDSCAEAC